MTSFSLYSWKSWILKKLSWLHSYSCWNGRLRIWTCETAVLRFILYCLIFSHPGDLMGSVRYCAVFMCLVSQFPYVSLYIHVLKLRSVYFHLSYLVPNLVWIAYPKMWNQYVCLFLVEAKGTNLSASVTYNSSILNCSLDLHWKKYILGPRFWCGNEQRWEVTHTG